MSVSRREFVACVACSCALACMVPPVDGAGDDTGAFPDDPDVDPTAIPGGHIDDYAVGDLDAVGNRVAVGRDEGGYFALSTICTHRGCDMAVRGDVSGDGLACHCHGSRFAVDGTVTRGPAIEPLPFWAVSIDTEGLIWVNREDEVEPDARALPPPPDTAAA